MMIFIATRLIEFLFFSILALSLSRCWQANVFSLGIQGFYLIASYCVVAFSLSFSSIIGESFGSWVNPLFFITSILISGGLTFGISKLFFHIFKRLKDDYFAIASLAFAEILIVVVNNIDIVGGTRGISLNHTLFFETAIQGKIFYLFLFLFIFLIFLFILYKKDKSMEDLIIKALGEKEIGVQHLGINTSLVREKVFATCGFWIGITGAIMTHYFISITPSNFSFLSSIPILLFVVIGNYSVKRTLFFSFMIYGLYELFKINFWGLLPVSVGNFLSEMHGVVYGMLLIASVQYIYYKKNVYRNKN